jgi:GNAT superfamily N-acetyltransferase
MTNSALPKTSSLSTPLDLQLSFRLATEVDLPKLEWMGQYIHFRRVFRYTFEEQQRGTRLMLVADVNNYPVGQIFMILRNVDEWNEERGYFYSLRVMDPFQGIGIGTKLMKEAEALLVNHEVYSASIAAAKDNPQARKLYEKLGYKIYTEDDGYWSYVDHLGHTIYVHEPCWMLEKQLK